MARTRIGEMLVQLGRLDPTQLQAALAHQQRWGGRLGGAIVRLGFLGEPAVLAAVGQQHGVPFVEIGDREIPPKVLSLVPRKVAQAHRVLPLELKTEGRRTTLVVAVADPADLAVLDELAFVTGLKVRPALAGELDLDRALERHMGITPPARAHGGFGSRADAIDLDSKRGGGRGGSGGSWN